MPKTKTAPLTRTDTVLRQIILQYFYDRNHNASSAMSDKTGAAVKISVVNRELKDRHSLKRQEVRRNLTYLISEGWVEEVVISKSVPVKSGMVIPQTTSYYRITAPGIDKIDGPGEFTMQRFHGINIEATGQNIITVGDGNQVDATYEKTANKLAEFKNQVRETGELAETEKLAVISNIESIQAQLAQSKPNQSVLKLLWGAVEKVVTGTSLAVNAATITGMLLAI